MTISLKADLKNVNWNELAEVYARAFNNRSDSARLRRVFGGSYLTRIAFDEAGRIVGAGYAISDSEMDATIHGIVVLPECQRQGIGRQIMQSLLDGLGTKAVLLTSNFGYEKFYESFGFKRHKTAFALRFPDVYLESSGDE